MKTKPSYQPLAPLDHEGDSFLSDTARDTARSLDPNGAYPLLVMDDEQWHDLSTIRPFFMEQDVSSRARYRFRGTVRPVRGVSLVASLSLVLAPLRRCMCRPATVDALPSESGSEATINPCFGESWPLIGRCIPRRKAEKTALPLALVRHGLGSGVGFITG